MDVECINDFGLVQQTEEQQETIDETIELTNFKLKKDKTVDGRDKDFRKCLSFANQKPYPTNLDGSPDMRFTTNPHILKIKLENMVKKK